MKFMPNTIPGIAKATFLIEGFASLIAWNSIVTAFDYLAMCYPNYDVAFTLTIPVFVGQTTFALFIYKISKYLSLNGRIVSSLLVMSLILVVLPIEANYMPNRAGFWVCALLHFGLGAGNSLMQSSGIALASLFPSECMSLLFTGTGFAGVLVCVLRIIILAIFGEHEEGVVIGTIVYFSISGIFLLLTIVIHFCFRKTLFCRYYLKKARSKTLLHQEELVEDIVLNPINIEEEIKREIDNDDNLEQLINKNFLEIDLKPLIEKTELKTNPKKFERTLSSYEEKAIFFEDYSKSSVSTKMHEEKHTWKFVWNVLGKIMPFPLLCCLVFIQTFLMFPGVSLKKHLGHGDLSYSMSSTLLILVFNVFDTVGKYLTSKLQTTSKWVIIFLILLRFLLFPFFIIMAQSRSAYIISDDWFAILNMALFAISNGYIVSSLMIIAPTKAKDSEKETAGFLMGLPLTLGIVIGSFLALSFTGI